MTRPFFEVFPREIRDQIYAFVLASPSGLINLQPWTVDVARSLSILRTCKQIRVECKAVIWQHNKLFLHEPSDIFQKFNSEWRLRNLQRATHLHISLELLDRNELEWIKSGLLALADHLGNLKTITLSAFRDKPRNMEEFQQELRLINYGEVVDGRLWTEWISRMTKMTIHTGWPKLAPWAKQKWLREMLLDGSGVEDLVTDIHEIFGGELWINGTLCFKDSIQVLNPLHLDPRDGEIQIIL